jgi:hypothetical protein
MTLNQSEFVDRDGDRVSLRNLPHVGDRANVRLPVLTHVQRFDTVVKKRQALVLGGGGSRHS